MKVVWQEVLQNVARGCAIGWQWVRQFFENRVRAVLFCLGVLFLLGIGDYALCARSARTFEFRSFKDDKTVIERRFVPRLYSKENAVGMYVSEYLLGPVNVNCSPLFFKGTTLRSVLIRKDTVYVDLSADAAFPVGEAKDVRQAVSLLEAGIRRNFFGLKRVKLFIEGHEPYTALFLDESTPKKRKSVDK